PRLRLQDFADAFLDRLAHGLFRVQLRLLRQVADLDPRLRPRLADEIGVHAGHDLEHRRLARAAQAQQADLGAGEERQRDVLDDLAFRRHGLADAVHGVDVLRHGGSGGQPPANRRRETSHARALERRRQGTWESRHYTGWRALPRACRTLNARARARRGTDWIQHRRAMLTARTQRGGLAACPRP